VVVLDGAALALGVVVLDGAALALGVVVLDGAALALGVVVLDRGGTRFFKESCLINRPFVRAGFKTASSGSPEVRLELS
jgi:hypothetical protein